MLHSGLFSRVLAIALCAAALRLSAAIVAVPFLGAPDVPLDKPVWFGEMPGRPGTFVILERLKGLVSLAVKDEDGKWTKSEFLKLSVNQDGEMGLLGLAFHPDFAKNRKYYLDYNPASGGLATVIEEREADISFARDAGKPPRRILRVDQGKETNHKGGTIAFGPKDGFLYVGMGDGGVSLNAQDRKSLLGKFLRVDVNAPDSFRVPKDNPFVGEAGTRPEIWALGLRNPWKWSFDPVTGVLWAGDVGETAREEIDRVARGQNLGWPFREGTFCHEPDSCDNPGLDNPVSELGRNLSTTVIGGVVYRGNSASPYYGSYFFSDFELGTLWMIQPVEGMPTAAFQKVITLPSGPSSFGTDALGNIYVAGYSEGIIYRLESPDLLAIGPGRDIRRAEKAKPFLRARRGSLWNPEAAGIRSDADVFTPQGRKRITLRASGPAPVLDLPEGCYFLKLREAGPAQVRTLLVD
jgi:glucose/arabinose dehydrogenase